MFFNIMAGWLRPFYKKWALGLVKKEAGLEGDGPYQDHSSLVQAVCASSPPTDFRNWYTPNLLAGPKETADERAKKASPITYVAEDAPPFLIIHGTKDSVVNYKQGKSFSEALKSAGAKDVELMTFNSGHGVFSQNSRKTYPAMEAFFQRVLKKWPKESCIY